MERNSQENSQRHRSQHPVHPGHYAVPRHPLKLQHQVRIGRLPIGWDTHMANIPVHGRRRLYFFPYALTPPPKGPILDPQATPLVQGHCIASC